MLDVVLVHARKDRAASLAEIDPISVTNQRPFLSGSFRWSRVQAIVTSRSETGDASGHRHGSRDAEVNHRPWQKERAEACSDPADGGREARPDPSDLSRGDLSRIDAGQRVVSGVDEGKDEE